VEAIMAASSAAGFASSFLEQATSVKAALSTVTDRDRFADAENMACPFCLRR
jgi:hypothetical protein